MPALQPESSHCGEGTNQPGEYSRSEESMSKEAVDIDMNLQAGGTRTERSLYSGKA